MGGDVPVNPTAPGLPAADRLTQGQVAELLLAHDAAHADCAGRLGDLCATSLATSSRFVQVAGHVWTNDTVRVVARNVSGFSVNLPAATLAVEVRKRAVP